MLTKSPNCQFLFEDNLERNKAEPGEAKGIF